MRKLLTKFLYFLAAKFAFGCLLSSCSNEHLKPIEVNPSGASAVESQEQPEDLSLVDSANPTDEEPSDWCMIDGTTGDVYQLADTKNIENLEDLDVPPLSFEFTDYYYIRCSEVLEVINEVN